MVADTGFTNGTPREPNDTGNGGKGAARHKPSEVLLMGRAVLEGWLRDQPDDLAAATKVLRETIDNPETRPQTRLFAARCLMEGTTQGLQTLCRWAEVADKMARLDAGEATENVRVFDIKIPEAEALNRGVG